MSEPENESLIRLFCFVSVLSAMNFWELLAPRRPWTARRMRRLTANYVLVVLNTVAVRILLPVSAASAALLAASKQWGLLYLFDWPGWFEILLSVVFFDLAIYGQHVLFHRGPLLWRIHKVHHADPDFDVSTALRFHTVEIVLSMLIKIGLVFLLGAPVWGVIAFEILLNGTAMFNHSNIRLPLPIDRFLRLLIVTPDMHRVHHSVVRVETDSNFGFCLPWWDRMFGTYRDQPEKGHEAMTIGLSEYPDEKITTRLFPLLAMPFVFSDENATRTDSTSSVPLHHRETTSEEPACRTDIDSDEQNSADRSTE